MNTIRLEGTDKDTAIIEVPEGDVEFISEDGRYFVDGEALINEMHRLLHEGMDAQSEPENDHEAQILLGCSIFAHQLLTHTRSRIEATELEFKLARSDA